MTGKWRLTVCAVLSAVLFSSCILLPEEEILPPPIIPRVEIALVTETVGRGDIIDYTRVSGRAAPINQYNIYLGFDIPGAVLIERHIDPDNLRVQAGDILAVFSADDLEAQMAPLLRTLEIAHINYNAAVRSLEEARANYEILQNRTEILREATMETYRRELDRLRGIADDAERRYEDYRALFEAGAISQDRFNNIERALRNAKDEYKSFESGMTNSEQLLNTQLEQNLRGARADARADAAVLRERVNLRTAQENVQNLQERTERFILRAPTDGIITYFTELFIGETYGYGQRLFTIADDSSLFVTVAFAQQRHLFVPGNYVELNASVSVGNERRNIEFAGTVISLSTDQRRDALLGDDTIVIYVADWPEEVKHGDLIWVYLTRARVYDVVTIPLNALNSIGDFHFVRIAQDGISRERQVEVGIRSSTMVEIVSGLTPGEEIVVR